MGHWKNRWIQTPQRILMHPCIKQASVLSKRFWIIPWPLAYNRLELDCIRKIINFWYTFGWKWRVFVTIWDCRTHVRMTSMTLSVERTDLDFKISVALIMTFFKMLNRLKGKYNLLIWHCFYWNFAYCKNVSLDEKWNKVSRSPYSLSWQRNVTDTPIKIFSTF